MRDADSFELLFGKRKNRTTPSTGYIGKRSFSLSLCEGERSPENWPYDGAMTSYYSSTQLYKETNSTATSSSADKLNLR